MRTECQVCGKSSRLIAGILSTCVDCIRSRPSEALPFILEAHGRIRGEFDLPPGPPRSAGGVECPICANACRLGEGEIGLCGLRTARGGQLVHLAGTPKGALVSWYDDPLPTNCVADWVCQGSREARTARGRGKVNLAVSYQACSFDCVFCQNWHFRLERPPGRVSAEELAAQAHRRTSCVCYFGGDPSPQMPHALAASHLLAQQGITICWETNGSAHPRLLDRAVELSLRSGGCIKFDLKAFDENLHLALTGVSNRRTLENFQRAARRTAERPDPPLLVAATLLVPGYVGAEEVGRIARFIAELDPDIPYALLGFHPHFFVPDLPRTSVRHAEEAEAAARAAGLTRVRVGNRHLLSRDY
ncbi:MAG: radical SAM protein [Anaerolineae bacterium]|nr:radical SAM protein [Anaerolineae bacterium]